MTTATISIQEALEQLNEIAQDAPFLALGQTVFWDEPMKAGIALASKRLGYQRRFVAGVHDTDYFAKIPSGVHQPGKFTTLSHNDTTTKGLWSAAGEFSALFGSETVVTRETLASGGLKLEPVKRARPDILDEATQAFGWRGVVSLDDAPPVTAEMPLQPVFRELCSAFDWALESSLECIAGQSRHSAHALAEEMRAKVCEAAEQEDSATLSGFYRRLLPAFYSFAAGVNVDIDTTVTTELLRFNTLTTGKPRFEILDLFIRPETKEIAKRAYDEAIQGTGLYELSRFGSGAIPFDLVIPGKGRGTIRIGNRGLVVMTRQPQFASFKKPLQNVYELAEVIERKFGPNCTLVGKAVTLIGMLAREFVFVFHEGASSYVRHSRSMHQALAQRGLPLKLNPILRVKYSAWDSLQVCCSWLHLPQPFHRPFGTEELCAPSLAQRWRQVGEEQQALIQTLGSLKRPIDLIHFLQEQVGGSWQCLSRDYESIHAELESLRAKIDSVATERRSMYGQIKALKSKRVDLERQKGEHFRDKFFEKTPTTEDEAERQRLISEIEHTIKEIEVARERVRSLMRSQRELAQSPDVLKAHDRRRSVELEAELKRMRLIRNAVIASKGMQNANLRPSAWWFPLVCPDGLWFRETVDSAECYLEPLV
ncbi:MAG: hypothetical protein J0H02_09130 [Armatimonadetes bacterium]|nr:hypothetical protein [Armatimonadota bacterium]